MRDQPRQQRGLSRTAPACKADDFHHNVISASRITRLEPPVPSLRAQRSASADKFWIASLRSQ
jgi:hypothetical protein